ncbi:MAG TPA: hypothetical protein VHF51_00480 [Solirubrobacteraceae bacterium]|nr:hypothetical protein [Solirubrobacteraceae bacterium]
MPASFLGVSIEWTSVEPFGGAARPGVVGLLRRVSRAAGAPLALRVGGASAEEAWWNPAGRARPPSIRQDLGPRTLDALARLARGLDAPVTVGLNLQLGDPANALALARAAQRRLGGRLDALEVGNEPDLYTTARDVGPPPVRRLRKRERYTPGDYVRDAGRFLEAVVPGLPRPPWSVVGGFAGRAGWAERALPALIDSRRGLVGSVSAHLYALPRCALDPEDPGGLRGRLLALAASEGRAGSLATVFHIAHRRGLPIRVSELNSVPCGGAPGVSDTFAAAVWLADALFALLRAGADRVHVHTWDGAVYGLFARAGATVRARPPFYGLLAFARAAPRGSRLVPVRVTGAGPRALRARATVDRARTVRLALLAASTARRVRVRVPVAPGRPCATLRLTTAPGPGARAGIAERGPRRHCPRAGAIALALPGASLAVLELPARRP